MTLTDITSVLKNPSAIDSFSIEEINALVLDHPNIPQVRAVLLQKRLHSGREFPVDFADTNYYYGDKQHFIHDVFRIQLDDENIDNKEHIAVANDNEHQISDTASTNNSTTSTRGIADIPESARDIEGNNLEKIEVEKSHVIGGDNLETSKSDVASHNLYDRIEASPYANWLLSLKQTNPITTSPSPADKSIDDTVKEKVDIKQENSDSTSADSETTERVQEATSKQISDESSTLNKEIASESLAELLAKQGHQSKAIAMYEKLSLIFPEKRAYFASQIKKIKR